MLLTCFFSSSFIGKEKIVDIKIGSLHSFIMSALCTRPPYYQLMIDDMYFTQLKLIIVRNTPSQDGIAILIVAVFTCFKADSFFFSLFLM